LIDLPGDTQVERDWLHKTLRIGTDATLRVTGLAARCRMVTLAQDDLPDDLRILRHVARDPGVCFGVYADVLTPGRVRHGDRVTTH
jgi:MOSC domain-containing protein YiiM